MGRANLLIVDEYRLVPLDVIDTVLRKMQADPRQPGFLSKPEYRGQKKYMERNKQIFLSSAWYKAHESWDRVESYNDQMVAGSSFFGCAIPYQISIMEGLKSEEEIQDEMSERTFNEVKFMMEMEAIFWGENLNSFFKYEEIKKNRTLTQVYYPQEIRDLIPNSVLAMPEKIDGEIRVVSADIAVMGGAKNDASIFTVARCIPVTNGYERQIIYMEAVDGGHTDTQANRLRQLFGDFECDYLVLDGQNNGVGIYDRLNVYTEDPERNVKYDPWTCINREDMASRCVYPEALPVVYIIKANGDMNSKIAAGFKDTLRRGKIKFPIHEDETKDTLEKIKGYKDLSPYDKTLMKLPYINTTLMETEILNLTDINEGVSDIIKVKEDRSGRKDRYSSVSYLDYFVAEYLEITNRQINSNLTAQAMFMARRGNRSRNRQSTGIF